MKAFEIQYCTRYNNTLGGICLQAKRNEIIDLKQAISSNDSKNLLRTNSLECAVMSLKVSNVQISNS